jgi:hypothetical protein
VSILEMFFPKAPEIVIPPAPPPPKAPVIEEAVRPPIVGGGELEGLRRARLGKRRFRSNVSLGIPQTAGPLSGLGVPKID